MDNSRAVSFNGMKNARLLYEVANCGEIPGELGFSLFEGGVVLPFRESPDCYLAGLVAGDGTHVGNSSLHELLEVKEYPLGENEEIIDDCRDVIYMGFLISQWGHALTDNLKRLWFLDSPAGKDLLAKGCRPVYVCDPDFNAQARVAELIRLAGFDIDDWECVRRPTRFRNVCNPDVALVEHKSGRLWSAGLSAVYDKILENVPDDESTYSQVYFSRTRLKNQPKWRETGEKQLEKLFRRKGYKIVYPEQMSLAKQINMLRHCRCFASTECSASHNAIWCRPGTRVVILQKARYYNSWQTAINNMRGLDVAYIETHRSIKVGDNPCGGPYYLCITHYLERFFGHRIPHLPRWLRISWWKYRFAKTSDKEGKGFGIPQIKGLPLLLFSSVLEAD